MQIKHLVVYLLCPCLCEIEHQDINKIILEKHLRTTERNKKVVPNGKTFENKYV